MTIQMIEARACVLSRGNVRRSTAPAATLDELAADIAARGVLQNLIGFAIAKKRGKYEITAGGRRLAAVHALIAAGRVPADYQLPVLVLNDTTAAAEVSLAENFQRQPMNPADECTAFRYFIEVEGKTAEDVARRFGLTTRFVDGRVRLAGLADEVFEALRCGEIGVDVAQAFGTISDIGRQAAVYAQVKGSPYNLNPASVRRAMLDETITGSNSLARLVGRDAYLAAGGRVETDLFGNAEEEIWVDSELVTALAEARMTEAAAQVGGFAQVVPVLAARPGYELTSELRPVRGERLPLDAAGEARLAEIEQQLEALEEQSESIDSDDEATALEARYEELQTEAQRLNNRIAPVDDDTRARATAFVVIGSDGTPELYETIYTEPADRHGGQPGDDASGDGDTRGAPDLGKPIRDELAVMRTKLLSLHIANDPGFAVDLMVFQLADAQVKPGGSTERSCSLQGGAPGRAPLGYKPEGAIADELASFGERLDYSWADHRSAAARFDAFRALDDDRRGAWAGWTMAKTLEPKLADESGASFHNHLGRSLGIDVAAWWRPTAQNYFGRVKKRVVLDALTAIGGSDLKNRYATAKKADLAEAAEKLCAGTSIVEAEIRAAAIAWIPDVMAFGIAESNSTTSDDTDGDPDEDEEAVLDSESGDAATDDDKLEQAA